MDHICKISLRSPNRKKFRVIEKSRNHIKIFVDGCNSIQFDWINKHTILPRLYKSPHRSRHVVNLLKPVRQLSSNSRSAKMSFSKVQRVFIVEHYLATRSYLTCQTEFRDTFPDSPVPNKSKTSRLVNRFRSLQKLFTGLHQTCGKEWMHASLNAVDISNTSYNIVFISMWFIFLTCVRNGLRDFFDHPLLEYSWSAVHKVLHKKGHKSQLRHSGTTHYWNCGTIPLWICKFGVKKKDWPKSYFLRKQN
jgi:hypothetical protein